jgi:hypothetical protein
MRCRGSLIALATDEIVMNRNAAFELPVSTIRRPTCTGLWNCSANPGSASLRRNIFQFWRASEAASKINDEL